MEPNRLVSPMLGPTVLAPGCLLPLVLSSDSRVSSTPTGKVFVHCSLCSFTQPGNRFCAAVNDIHEILLWPEVPWVSIFEFLLRASMRDSSLSGHLGKCEQLSCMSCSSCTGEEKGSCANVLARAGSVEGRMSGAIRGSSLTTETVSKLTSLIPVSLPAVLVVLSVSLSLCRLVCVS